MLGIRTREDAAAAGELCAQASRALFDPTGDAPRL